MFASRLRLLVWVALLAFMAPACRSDAEADAPDTSSATAPEPGGGGGELAEPPPPTPVEPAVAHFEHKPIPQGATRVEVGETTMTMTMTVSLNDEVIRDGRTSQHSEKRKQVTLLEVDTSGAPVKARIVYEKLTETHQVGDDKPKAKPNPLDGQSYTVQLADGQMTVKDAKGADAPAAESDEVIADNGDLLKPNMLHKLIPRGAIKVGERLTVNEAFLRQLFEADADGSVNVEEAWLSLKEVREVKGQRAGVFETRMRMTAPVHQIDMSFDLTGEFVVSLQDAQLVTMRLKGPVRFSTPEGESGPKGVQIEGKGEIAIRQEHAPAP